MRVANVPNYYCLSCCDNLVCVLEDGVLHFEHKSSECPLDKLKFTKLLSDFSVEV